MKIQVTIDGCTSTIWRHVPRQRATGLEVRHITEQPGFHGGRFVPRRLGPAGICLQPTGQQAGFELWTESEKLEVWPAQPLSVGEIAALHTAANSIATKAGETIAAQITRKPLTGEEYQIVQQERLIAAMPERGAADASKDSEACPTCGWRHDAEFTQVVIPKRKPITLAGVLPDIVACVHTALAKGLPRVSTKDEELLRRCGGYSNACKAFYDRHQREAYQELFDTSRRGFIALRRCA